MLGNGAREVRWQLITNHGLSVQLVNSLLCRQCYTYCDETAETRITQFSLYLSYLRIKFDTKFEFQV